MGRLFWKFFTIIWLTLAVCIAGVIAITVSTQATPFSSEVAQRQESYTLDVAEQLLRTKGPTAAVQFAEAARLAPDPVRFSIRAVDGITGCGGPGTDRHRYIVSASTCFRLEIEGPAPDFFERGWPKLTPWIAALIASALAAYWLARYLIHPVAYIRQGLSALAQGRFDVRIADKMEGRKDEVTALAHDFDTSAARLQSLQASQQRLFHDVSHELRSPLSRLQAALGVLRQNPARLDPMMERMDREIERLDGLIGEILTLARLSDRSEGGIELQALDVIDLLNEIVADAAFEGQTRGIEIVADTPGSFVAVVNGELVYRALENVVRNALKYTADHSLITVAGTIIADRLRLMVTDQGRGMPADNIEAMFRPFFRGENAIEQDGHGLGLAITRQAIERHGGQVSAAPAPGGGLTVTIEIPRSWP